MFYVTKEKLIQYKKKKPKYLFTGFYSHIWWGEH